MSTVYRGERDDSQYQQTVAIKVLQHATLHPRLRSRLHSERHILATLDHPSIARLIDSGDLEDGTPYLVMEYVDGESIDSYCDSRTLFVRERLELFVKVCAAVQYAHRNLVVHRDIKSSNIFVTVEGAPKLLDFGIAKLLAPESLSHTLPVTRLQERILTPENAAPEQVLGRPITTATDIYALGVLLYQLLTGRSPYRLLGYSQLQLERAICMDDPARPSQMVISKLNGEKDADRSRISDRRRLSPQRLRARLSGDLDAIVAMAMRKEPDRRYPSVEALADDLNRHLLGEPVRARQGDWRYNAAKFLRRHLLAVVAVAAAFLGLALFAGAMFWENHRIELAREATAQERDRAQQVSAFLVDVFSQADPFNTQGKEPTAKDLLDRGAEKISGNVSLQPEVRAQLLESIGLAYRRQGLSERAIPLFEQAVAIRRQERPLDNSHVAVAVANLARAHTDAGHLISAEAYLDQAVTLSQSGGGTQAVLTADILVQFGNFALDAKSDPARAAQVFGADNARIAQIESDLGVLYDREGDMTRAITATQTALKITRDRRGSGHYIVGYHLDALANLYLKINDLPTAEADARQALAVYAQALPARHLYVASTHQLLGEVLLRRGSLAAAEAELRVALDMALGLAGADSWRTARSEASLGWVLIQRDNAAEGEPMLVAARSKLLAAVGPQPPATQQATARL